MQKLTFLYLLALASPSYVAGYSYRASDGSDVNLMIAGAIVSRDLSDNVALVKDGLSGRVEAVKAGSKIRTGLFEVIEVTKKYMVVKNQHERLLIYQNKFAANFLKQKTPLDQKTYDKAVAEMDVFSEEGFERAGNEVKISRALKDKLIQEELTTILMQAAAIPEIVDGKVVGFRMVDIDKGSIYDKAGIRDGDVISSINQFPLNSVAGAIKLLQSLKTADKITMELASDSQAKRQINFNVL